jgi:hypothetical protein
MAKNMLDNPILIDRHPYRSPNTNEVVAEIEPVCGCGCKSTPNAYNYEGEMFASKDCVIKMMLSEGWLKEIA